MRDEGVAVALGRSSKFVEVMMRRKLTCSNFTTQHLKLVFSSLF